MKMNFISYSSSKSHRSLFDGIKLDEKLIIMLAIVDYYLKVHCQL